MNPNGKHAQTNPSLMALRSQQGFTLLEMILVIALMATVYAVALPDMTILESTAVSSKLGRLTADIRAASDISVLTQRPYRMVFMLASGDYWLETTSAESFYLGNHDLGRDYTVNEEREIRENFDADFGAYEELAGSEIEDHEHDRVIAPISPVVRAKDQLRPVEWQRVVSNEWKARTIGPELIFQDFRALHHDAPQTFQDLGEEARAILYFFAGGYIEPAVFHLAFRKGEFEFDTEKQPYTLVTKPYEGVVEVNSGYEEIDLHERFDKK